MVPPFSKVIRTCEDSHAGHSAKREEEREQRKRWENNIQEWTGLTLGETLRKAEKREEWKVARASVAPQRSARLRVKKDSFKVVAAMIL